MDKQQKWIELIEKLPALVGGAIGLATAIISFVVLVQRNHYLGITILGMLLLVATLCLCLYLAFAKIPPLIEGGKGIYRFEAYRLWALVGIGLVLVIIGATLAFKPSRSFIATAFVGTATPLPSPTSTPLPPPTSTPSPPPPPSPTSTPVLGVIVGDVKWRGPSNYCTVILDDETVYMPVANPGHSHRYEPRDFFYPGDAVVSFDLLASQEIKVSDIIVEVVNYQSVPPIRECPPTPSPLGEAHMFLAQVDAPSVAGKSRFPAYLVAETGTPGFVWLAPDDPVSFFILVEAETPGLYTLRCCDIELSQMEIERKVQIDSESQILFMSLRP